MGISSPIGSPPHMRGKGIKPCNQRVRMGITPAYAGKSFPFFGIIRLHWDHPRICGEKTAMCRDFGVSEGSPPHMRGKGIKPCNQRVRMGITPAYAGKSFPFFGIIRLHWDHPRICGEKQYRPRRLRRCLGSPPHMRGKDRVLCRKGRFLGITPAYAGKSFADHFVRH